VAKKELNLKIAGEAGWGIRAAGEMFAKTCSRGGLHIFGYVEYPSLIRGGHNVYQVRASRDPVYSQTRILDLLIALNKETVVLHQEELAPDAGIIFDNSKFDLKDIKLPSGVQEYGIPLEKLAKEAGMALMRNTVALGAAVAAFGLNLKLLFSVIENEFADKKPAVIEGNKKAAQLGHDFFLDKFAVSGEYDFTQVNTREQLVITGNDACALGALAAGCQLYAAYPMTPSSGVLHFLAVHGPDYGMIVRHPEDEIGVINEIIGASYAGARVMGGTSGGGFALMNEGFALAGMTETPLVMVVAQRPGPATGLPTWTEQGELSWMLNAGHGEFPRIVLAPGDVEEAFWLTVKAFNLADHCQTPALVLTDKHLAESHMSCQTFNLEDVKINRGKWVPDEDAEKLTEYQRYLLSSDGISPRLNPGTPKVVVRANSDEHDELGLSTEEADIRVQMVNKRLQKYKTAKELQKDPKLLGSVEADLTFVGWGSTKGAVKEAVKLLADQGIKANQLHLNFLQPFPSVAVSKTLTAAKRPILVENNATGQLGKLIRQETGFELKEKLLKYDGRPFYPEDLVEAVS
jgi:2-oxoglutarate ferredoxin oxidoreductase subunit alpha